MAQKSTALSCLMTLHGADITLATQIRALLACAGLYVSAVFGIVSCCTVVYRTGHGHLQQHLICQGGVCPPEPPGAQAGRQ
jgi:hypothetical protein